MFVAAGVPANVESYDYDSPQYGRQVGIGFRLDHPAIASDKYHERVECPAGDLADQIEAASKSGEVLTLLVNAIAVPGKNGKRSWSKLKVQGIVPASK